MKMKFVYFVKPVGMNGPIKIGTSLYPDERILKFAVWSPFPLEVIGTIPRGMASETYLHHRFSHQHSHREWFHSSPLLLQTIERLLSGEHLSSVCAGLPVHGPILPGNPNRYKHMHRKKYKRHQSRIPLEAA